MPPRTGKPSKAATWQIAGASVMGPAHRSADLPNQDAWLAKRYAFGDVLAVSDGMGSKPHAREGARAACKAVMEAAKLWTRTDDAPIELFLRLMHHIWYLLVFPNPPRDCAATCLFALRLNCDRLVIGQLGDGALMVVGPDDFFCLDAGAADDFSNETTALGVATRLDEWQWRDTQVAANTAILLCTDGVASDLLPERRQDFVEHFVSMCDPLTGRQRAGRLRGELTNWPTPGHSDDKTVAVMWHTETGSSEG